LNKRFDLPLVFVSGVYFLIALLLIGTRLFFSLGFVTSNIDIFWTLLVQLLIMGVVPVVAIMIYRRVSDQRSALRGERPAFRGQGSALSTQSSSVQRLASDTDASTPPKNSSLVAQRCSLTTQRCSLISNAFSTLYFKRCSKKIIYLSIAIGALVFLANIAVATFFNALISLTGYTGMPFARTPISDNVLISLVYGLILTAVFPSVFEEITHRGLLIRGYKSLGYIKAIIYSSIMFGLMHSFIQQTFYAFFIGLLLGLLTIFSKSIWPAMIVHFMNNGLSVLMSVTSTYTKTGRAGLGDYFYAFLNIGLNNTFSAFLMLVLFAAVGYAIYKLTRVFIKENLTKDNAFITEAVTDALDKMLKTNVSVRERKEKFLANLFFIATIFLLGFTTVATFIWGIVR